ncbi:MAG: peptide chain release factor 2 [Leptospirales bacterium]|nr:peptide chain release factor 2 [Leptospirales bacterium]
MAEYRNKTELLKAFEELRAEFQSRWKEHGIDALVHELGDLEIETARPDFWDRADRARDISMKKSEMERRAAPWRHLQQELSDFPDLVDLTLEEFQQDPRSAMESLSADFRTLEERFEELLLSEALSGSDDGRDAIVTISSGAGGTESQDWAEMLLRMYSRWLESRGFRTEILDYQDGEEAGIKSASLMVRGDHAFGNLKSENGVHRLVRISPFDSQKRRHTSFAAVHVTPDIEDSIDVQVEEKDLRVDTYRASGAGGQHINKTDSAIRITHIPSGIVVQCQNERSQHKNRSTAMKMLKARLYELERQKIQADIESRSGEKNDVSWGNQIRSYVFHPYKMVKDLRTQHETGDVEGVMNGNLDPFVKAFLKSSASGKPLKAVQEKDI